MKNKFEQKWVAFIDSNGYRKFAKRKTVSRIIKSKLYQSLNSYRRYAITYYKANRTREIFRDIDLFCFFIGQTKSGCSMVGGLLDAHPNIIISDEVDVLQYVQEGFNREQIFHLLLHTSKRELMKGRVTARRLQPYSFLVPDQWQGRYSKLLTIGDSTAAKTTQRLADDNELIMNLEKLMKDIPVKVIQVVRNPFDPISIMMIRGKRSFENALQHYFEDCETLIKVRNQLKSDQLFLVHYEDFVRSPVSELSGLCSFLNTEASEGYLESCARILSDSPQKSRDMIQWGHEWIDQVQARIDQYDFLKGYNFCN